MDTDDSNGQNGSEGIDDGTDNVDRTHVDIAEVVTFPENEPSRSDGEIIAQEDAGIVRIALESESYEVMIGMVPDRAEQFADGIQEAVQEARDDD